MHSNKYINIPKQKYLPLTNPTPSPLISIIIATYNRSYCLKATIELAVNQTYRDPYMYDEIREMSELKISQNKLLVICLQLYNFLIDIETKQQLYAIVKKPGLSIIILKKRIQKVLYGTNYQFTFIKA